MNKEEIEKVIDKIVMERGYTIPPNFDYMLLRSDAVKAVLSCVPSIPSEGEGLKLRSEDITLLELYSEFLEENIYLDTDWRSEEPFAIDEFLKSESYKSRLSLPVKE